MFTQKAFVITIVALLAATSSFCQRTLPLEYDAGKKEFEFHNVSRIPLRGRNPSASDQYIIEAKDYNYVLYTPIIKVLPRRFKIFVPDGLKSYVGFADFTRDSDFGVALPSPALRYKADFQKDTKALDDALVVINAEKVAIDEKIKNLQTRLTGENGKKSPNPTTVRNLNAAIDELEERQWVLSRRQNELKQEKQRRDGIVATLDNFTAQYKKVIEVEAIMVQLAKDLANKIDNPSDCEDLRNAALAALNTALKESGKDAEAIDREFAATLDRCTALKESLALQLGGSGSTGYDVQTLALVDEALIASEAVKRKSETLSKSVKQFKSLFEKTQTKKSAVYTHRYDYALVSIKLVNNQNSADTVLKQQLKLYSSRGLDVDFSIGMIYNNLYKRTWYVDTVGANSIKQEGGFRGDLAWTGLINFSYRTGADSRFGISIGPGLSLMDGNMRYVLGLHAYFGKRDLVGLSGGLCAGKRNFLPKTVSSNGNDPNDNLPATITSVTPYEKYRIGWYAGIFYNFTRQ